MITKNEIKNYVGKTILMGKVIRGKTIGAPKPHVVDEVINTGFGFTNTVFDGMIVKLTNPNTKITKMVADNLQGVPTFDEVIFEEVEK